MNSYGDGNTYRGMVCKDSEVETVVCKVAYTGKDYPVHTDGPWEIIHDEVIGDGRTIAAGAKYIAAVQFGVFGENDPRTISEEEHEANCKLIAAAPFMLIVLRWLDNEMDVRDDDFGGVLFTRVDFQRVRAAIRFAMTGKI